MGKLTKAISLVLIAFCLAGAGWQLIARAGLGGGSGPSAREKDDVANEACARIALDGKKPLDKNDWRIRDCQKGSMCAATKQEIERNPANRNKLGCYQSAQAQLRCVDSGPSNLIAVRDVYCWGKDGKVSENPWSSMGSCEKHCLGK